MSTTTRIIGPQDHGRRMSLAEFEPIEVQPGYLYELSRGVVTVSDVPNPIHLAQVMAIKRQLGAYDLAHPGVLHSIAGSGECKILVGKLESERHPDFAIYKNPPPQGGNIWSAWIPEIVIEIVSPGSEHRDYVEKREEYLAFGVREYWIVDAGRQEVLILHRSGDQWSERVLRPPKVYRTRLLPGFEFACEAVFQAAAGR